MSQCWGHCQHLRGKGQAASLPAMCNAVNTPPPKARQVAQVRAERRPNWSSSTTQCYVWLGAGRVTAGKHNPVLIKRVSVRVHTCVHPIACSDPGHPSCSPFTVSSRSDPGAGPGEAIPGPLRSATWWPRNSDAELSRP